MMDLFEEIGTYIGIGISNIINVINPDLIIIGGEFSKCGDLYLSKAKEIIRQKAWKWSNANITLSKLEDDSAAIGAASLFIQRIFTGDVTNIFD